MYRYGMLIPSRLPHAASRNRPLIGPLTMGIEVTEPELARECGLGNIDPQHTSPPTGRAAIEECWASSPPPSGARLVTLRPDLDSIGGMAVLALKAGQHSFVPGSQSRMRKIACADRFQRGAWPGPRPLPQRLSDFDEDGLPDLAGIAGLCFDHMVPMDRKVRAMEEWLIKGVEPERYRRRWVLIRQLLLAALGSAALRLSLGCGGRVAVIETLLPDALALGYRLAPVVVARNPASVDGGKPPHVKYTISQYGLGHADFATLQADLASIEPGWAGSDTIIGSPQGIGSKLCLGSVVAAAGRALFSRPTRD